MGSAHAKYECTTCRREFPILPLRRNYLEWCRECGRTRCEDCSDYERLCLDDPKLCTAEERREARLVDRAVGHLYDDSVDVRDCLDWLDTFNDPALVIPTGYDPNVVHRWEAAAIAERLLELSALARERGDPMMSNDEDDDDDGPIRGLSFRPQAPAPQPAPAQVDAVVRAGKPWNYYFDFQKRERIRPDAVIPFDLPEPTADRVGPAAG